MGYYGSYTQARRTRQNNPELVARIEKTAKGAIATMTDWERSFLGSLLDSAKKWGRLTAKQHEVYQRIEKKSDPAFQKARKTWNDNYTPAMREQATFAANYYEANPPYFSDAAHRILTDEKFIPSEKLYRKMVENKYVQRAKENHAASPKFSAGSMAMVRDSAHVQGRLCAYRGQLVMIIEVEEDVRSATKGARKMTILPVGSTEMVVVEERYLKNAKV
jgi:hypothetical protein|tara:strand:+ start:40691 stop:41347 length:657 start_codon:yes stop_codon:yes gene_type:complete